jgi:GNAT superfamily N-acetyltransferase
MQIREISLEEVWKIRQEVFWPNEPLDFIKMEKDPEGVHLGLFDPHLLSVVSLFRAGNEIQFRKLGTLDAFQGRGYGTHLMNHILEIAHQEGLNRIWCNARTPKKSFYEKLGMRETGNYFSRDGVDFTIMEIVLG